MPDVIYICAEDLEDPRLATLAEMLGVELARAIGIVLSLWSHSFAHNPSAEFPGKGDDVWRCALSPREWSPGVLATALVAAGFVDILECGRWVLRDWAEQVRRAELVRQERETQSQAQP